MAWDTALGAGLDQVWQVLLAGESGIRPVPSGHRLRNDLAAALPDLPLDDSHRERQHTLGLRTLRAAVADADLDITDPRLRLVVGTSYGPDLDVPADSLARWSDELAAAAEMGAPVTVSTACSAGSDAVMVGAALIADGVTELCVVGGVDILTPAKRLGHSALGTMSPTTLRAFDTARDGMILGEGAAFLVLESEQSAAARGARVHGVVAGAGSANDAQGATAPDPSGDTVVRAIESALRAAARDVSEVAVVNAHGSGTPVNDDVETQSFRRTLKPGVVVFATKGAFGHTLGATGALEAVAVLLALRDQRVPPVHGLTDPLADFPLRLPVGEALAFSGSVGLSVTLGFGGFNTCLVLETL